MYISPPFLKTVEANIDGRDFVVGDLHGCFDELGFLLKHIKFNPTTDRLFSTGDLMDRGPKSLECVSLLNKTWFYPVLGNHEDILLIKNSMIEKDDIASITNEEINYLSQFKPYINQFFDMPLVYEINHLIHKKIYLIHAEILPEHLNKFSSDEFGESEYSTYLSAMQKYDFSDKIVQFFEANKNTTLEYNLKQKLLWSRKNISLFYKNHKDEIEVSDFEALEREKFIANTKIFCGHNIVPFPMKIGQQFYIDTGAALGHAQRDINFNLFSQFGNEFFALSLVDLTTGICYGYVTSGEKKGRIFKLENSLYD
jgi:Calcineurin-like phosphoesterase